MSLNNRLSLGAEVDKQAIQSFIKPDSRLQAALSNSTAKGLPPIEINPLQGQFLSIQCQLIGAKNVLEIGALGGYSSIWFASTGAKVTSIEINPKHAEVARENCKGLDVDFIVGSALDVLPKLEAEGRKFDFVFIDADWEQQAEYFQWAVKLTRVNGCIYVDNVVRALLYEAETEGGKISAENLLTRAGVEKKVATTLISTISSHKPDIEDRYDGFLMVIVKSA